jgi:hypothetical protein
MIQRIQTLFLFIVFGLNLAIFFVPIASFFDSPVYTVDFGLLGVREYTHYHADWPDTIYLAAITGLICLLSFITVFMYKRRMMQIRFIRFMILLSIIFLALIFFFYVPNLEALTQTRADYISQPGIYLSIASVLFLILASRFIMKDEKLIRSANRLR